MVRSRKSGPVLVTFRLRVVLFFIIRLLQGIGVPSAAIPPPSRRPSPGRSPPPPPPLRQSGSSSSFSFVCVSPYTTSIPRVATVSSGGREFLGIFPCELFGPG